MSLISKSKKGNKEAFSMLIEEYKLPIYKTAKAILKNEDDVCDAIQETLISIYSNIKTLKDEKYFKTWAIRITINKCYDIIARNDVNNKKVVLMQNATEIIENESEDKSNVKIDLDRALSLIDNDLKIVTVLYYYDDVSVKEIADILGIPVGTIKSKLSRAREKMYKILKQEEVKHDG